MGTKSLSFWKGTSLPMVGKGITLNSNLLYLMPYSIARSASKVKCGGVDKK
nr:hypothetical protein [uncultured archaeon]